MFDLTDLFDFMHDLRLNNNREWFAANKERYNGCREVFERLVNVVIAVTASVDDGAKYLTVKDCTYRIYRDTRFSADKTPYKTHMGIFVCPPFGKRVNRAGYYFHLEPNECCICAGTVGLESRVVRGIRNAIVDNIDEYRSIVEDAEFRRLFPELGMNLLRTAPKGFDRNYEFISYLRPRDFIAQCHVDDGFFKRKVETIADDLHPYIVQAKRFNDFLNFTIDDFIR